MTNVAPMPSRALVEGVALRKDFPARGRLLHRTRGRLRAVDAVDIRILPGEVLGVVGESGSGKSTLGRLVLRLLELSAGHIAFDGVDITHLPAAQLRPLRGRMQMIFQDPYASLNPRMTVGDAIGEALRLRTPMPRGALQDRVAELLRQVGLAPEHMHRYPRAFSGGQRQRIAIARALAGRPDFLVADEPVSALDVSIQAGIISLLRTLREERGLAMMFISHDLSIVELLSDRVLILYLGRTMETGPTAAVFADPQHPYTRALLSAVPGRDRVSGRRSFAIEGELPSPLAPPSGCVFRTRCPFATKTCAETVPPLEPVGAARASACLRRDAIDLR
jgi:oligopeptide/dipeptide ABC transporter ATP-binding protein